MAVKCPPVTPGRAIREEGQQMHYAQLLVWSVCSPAIDNEPYDLCTAMVLSTSWGLVILSCRLPSLGCWVGSLASSLVPAISPLSSDSSPIHSSPGNCPLSQAVLCLPRHSHGKQPVQDPGFPQADANFLLSPSWFRLSLFYFLIKNSSLKCFAGKPSSPRGTCPYIPG